jgi:hypothetical protein
VLAPARRRRTGYDRPTRPRKWEAFMLNIPQFRTNIVRPTLEAIGAHNRAAENLVLGTALQESNLHYLRQLNEGPARGIYQMEPATHDDIWDNFLAYRTELRERVSAFLVADHDRVDQLVWNLAYATAMCRVHYMRVRHALPSPDDVRGLAEYWKQYYNTPQGRGTADEFAQKYEDQVVRTGDN